MIAWVVGVVVGGAALFYGADQLYFQSKAKMQADIVKAKEDFKKYEQLKSDGRKAWDDWNAMELWNDVTKVESPVRNLVFQLAQVNNFSIRNWSNASPRALSAKQPDFQEITFTAGATTTTARLGRFLAMLESQSNMAIKVEGLKIASRKPGQDDLNVEMTIRAVAYIPPKKSEFNLAAPPPTGLERPTPAASSPGPVARGGTRGTTTGPSSYDYYPQSSYNLLNAPLGSLDAGLPFPTSGPGAISMEENLKKRREYQLTGQKLPKPRFGDEPLELRPGETEEQAMARRKEEQMKAAETQAAALLAAEAEAARKRALEEEANKPKLLEGETMEEYLIRKRKEQEVATGGAAPATRSDVATSTEPSTQPGGQR
jgi:hypothetical protein